MNNKESLPYLLINTAQKLKTSIQNQNNNQPKPIPFSLLANLVNGEKTAQQLTELMQCSKQEISRQIKRAIENDWIEQKNNPNDGRSKVISLSRKGKSLIIEGSKYYQQLETDWQKKLSKRKINELKSLLKDINQILG